MGWDFHSDHNTKQKLVDYLCRTFDGTNATCETIKHKLVPEGLWQLIKQTYHDGSKDPDILIIFNFIEYDKQDKTYGFKTIEESEHPFAYDCPISYLKAAPVKSSEWREKVMKLHEIHNKFKTLHAGATLTVKNPFEFQSGHKSNVFVATDKKNIYKSASTSMMLCRISIQQFVDHGVEITY